MKLFGRRGLSKNRGTDESFFTLIFSIDEGDLWSDPNSWGKANPAWGNLDRPDSRSERMQARAAIAGDAEYVQVLAPKCLGHARRVGRTVFRRSHCAQVLRQHFIGKKLRRPSGDNRNRFSVENWTSVVATRLAKIWIPENTLKESANAAYSAWTETGELIGANFLKELRWKRFVHRRTSAYGVCRANHSVLETFAFRRWLDQLFVEANGLPGNRSPTEEFLDAAPARIPESLALLRILKQTVDSGGEVHSKFLRMNGKTGHRILLEGN
jgi:hypothetical protein